MLWVHWAGREGWPQPPSAFLAVDLFFMLSGFVLAAAYGDALAQGMGFRRFMGVRLIRMAPLNLAATAIMALVWIATIGHPGSWSPIQAASILLPMAAFVPAPLGIEHAGFSWLFPANPPLWSIFYELVANAAFVLAARRLGAWGIAAIGVAAGLVHLGHGIHYGYLNYGAEWGDLIDGTARAFFGFFGGVALFRLRDRLPRVRVPALLLVLLVAALLYGELSSHYYVVCLYLLFPAIIHLAADNELPDNPVVRPLVRPLLIGGALSYGIYVLHVPVRAAFVAAAGGEDRLGIVATAAAVLVLIAGTYALDRWYDAPLRRRLRGRWGL